jgi:hypothetical protein
MSKDGRPAMPIARAWTTSLSVAVRSFRAWLSRLMTSLGLTVISAVASAGLLLPPMIVCGALGGTAPEGLLLAAVFVVMLIVIHELGHALAAWSVGWDVHIIGVLRLHFFPAGQEFRDVREFAPPDVGGFVFATPAQPEAWNGAGYVFFVFGGPLANFTVAAVGFAGLALANPYFSAAPGLIAAFSTSSFFAGLANLVPLRIKAAHSDGWLLFDHLRGRRRSLLSHAQARMMGLTHDRVPPRRWDTALAERILDESRDPYWLLRAANIFLAQGVPAQTLAAMRAAHRAEPSVRTPPAIMAFLVALVERDTAAARQVLAECGDERGYDFEALRALAVILAVEGRRDEARAVVAKARLFDGKGDEDDKVLLSAIEEGRDLPTRFAAAA